MLTIDENYSEKFFAVFGDTKDYKQDLKQLGGKFNENINGKPGWVFLNFSKNKVKEFITNLEATIPVLDIKDYSEKSFVIYGDTKRFKEELKVLGGRYNSNLNGKSGWVFSIKSKDNINEWLLHLKDQKKIDF